MTNRQAMWLMIVGCAAVFAAGVVDGGLIVLLGGHG